MVQNQQKVQKEDISAELTRENGVEQEAYKTVERSENLTKGRSDGKEQDDRVLSQITNLYVTKK